MVASIKAAQHNFRTGTGPTRETQGSRKKAPTAGAFLLLPVCRQGISLPMAFLFISKSVRQRACPECLAHPGQARFVCPHRPARPAGREPERLRLAAVARPGHQYSLRHSSVMAMLTCSSSPPRRTRSWIVSPARTTSMMSVM